MRRPFLGAFLGSLLQPLLTRLGLKLSGGALLLLALAVGLVVRWWQQQPTWVHLLLVCALAAFLLRARLPRHLPTWGRSSPAARLPLDDQPHFLYRWWSEDGELLYVGISNDLARRTGQHVKDKPWMVPGVRCQAESYPSRAAVLEAEEQAIYAENPRWNVVHNRGPLW